MFAKEHDLSSSTKTLLKNKEKRALRAALIECLSCSDDALEALVPSKGDVELTKLKSKVKLLSQKGEACPLFFDTSLGKGKPQYVPTVYAAWRQPNVVPNLLVHSKVSIPLLRGADLMAPGVLVPPSGLPDLGVDAPVAIRVLGNPMPFAVGVTEVSTADAVAGGMRGRFVRILHRYRDVLWAAGGRAVPNDGFGAASVDPIPGGMEDDVIALGWATTEEAEMSEGAHGASEAGEGAVDGDGAAVASASASSAADAEEGAASAAAAGGGEDAAGSAAPSGVGAGGAVLLERLLALDASDLLYSCTLQALRTRVKPRMLPRLVNIFFSSDVLPCRPVGSEIDVKASKWGKVSALLEEIAESGAITLEETDGGGVQIADIDRSHEVIRAHKPWPVGITEAAASGSGDGAGAEGDEAAGASIGAVSVGLREPELDILLRAGSRVEMVYAAVLQETSRRVHLRIAEAAFRAGVEARKAARAAAGLPAVQGQADEEDAPSEEAAAGIEAAVAEAAGRAEAEAEEASKAMPGRDISHLRKRSLITPMTKRQQRLKALTDPLELVRARRFTAAEAVNVLGLYASMRGLKESGKRGSMLADEHLVAALSLSAAELEKVPPAVLEAATAAGLQSAAGVSAEAAFPSLLGGGKGKAGGGKSGWGSAATKEAAAKAAEEAAAAAAAQAAEPVLDESAALPEMPLVLPPAAPVGGVAKKLAMQRFTASHDSWYILTSATGDQTCKAGDPPQVEVEVKQVRGRKMRITLVRNLDFVGIRPSDLVRPFSKLFASTASEQPTERDPSQAEVLVQGDWGERVVDFLNEKYGVPRRLIAIVGDGTSKTGKTPSMLATASSGAGGGDGDGGGGGGGGKGGGRGGGRGSGKGGGKGGSKGDDGGGGGDGGGKGSKSRGGKGKGGKRR